MLRIFVQWRALNYFLSTTRQSFPISRKSCGGTAHIMLWRQACKLRCGIIVCCKRRHTKARGHRPWLSVNRLVCQCCTIIRKLYDDNAGGNAFRLSFRNDSADLHGTAISVKNRLPEQMSFEIKHAYRWGRGRGLVGRACWTSLLILSYMALESADSML